MTGLESYLGRRVVLTAAPMAFVGVLSQVDDEKVVIRIGKSDKVATVKEIRREAVTNVVAFKEGEQ